MQLKCLKFNLIPLICTSNQKNDDRLIKIAKKNKIKYFRGSSKNKMKRWKDCASISK